ncbi:MAG TPA: transposase [Pseudonocardiaceae bacterium]|nr:transposase [Pseudonocardiaceae bacterium]
MDSALKRRLVPDELWILVEQMIPPAPVRPQGGGRRRVGPRDILTAIVYVLMMDVSWRRLPNTLGISTPTAYRRYLEWHESGVWTSLLDATEQQQEGENAAWISAIARAALNRPVLPRTGDQPAGRR